MRLLIDADIALIGIDAALDGPAGPVRHALVGADIPFLEHVRSLDRLPGTGARLIVLPPPVRLGLVAVRRAAPGVRAAPRSIYRR